MTSGGVALAEGVFASNIMAAWCGDVAASPYAFSEKDICLA
jgi:hypothetical protein